jgi:hypothetical protein
MHQITFFLTLAALSLQLLEAHPSHLPHLSHRSHRSHRSHLSHLSHLSHPSHPSHPSHLEPARLLTQAKAQFRARLSVVPIDVAMQGTIAGSGSVTATLAGTRLTLKGTFSDLKTSATVARVHVAPRGIRGPAILDLTVSKGTSGTIEGTFDLTPQQVDDLMKSRFYIQLHSEKAPDGNLWGWLLPQEARK